MHAPKIATPSADPLCRAAFSAAAATPARRRSTVPSAGDVAAGEMNPDAKPIASIGATASHAGVVAPMPVMPSAPAA